jgi:hypothetical protein
MRTRWIGWILALVALLAGCGGTAAEPARAPAPGVEFQRYLDSMRAPDERFDALVKGVVAAFGGVDVAKPDAAWTRAAARLQRLGRRFDDLGAAISRVRAPAEIAGLHRDFAQSALAFGRYVDRVELALEARAPNRVVRAATADTTTIKAARAAWVAAVQDACKRRHLLPPDWLVPSPAG